MWCLFGKTKLLLSRAKHGAGASLSAAGASLPVFGRTSDATDLSFNLLCAPEVNTPAGIIHSKWRVSLVIHTQCSSRRITNWTTVTDLMRWLCSAGQLS